MEEFAGAGDGPTVVLVSGSLMPALLWAPVQQQLAQFARVVSYDRAGCGFSEPAGRDRSGERVVEELDTLLEEWRGRSSSRGCAESAALGATEPIWPSPALYARKPRPTDRG